jgi:hypothetical protein
MSAVVAMYREERWWEGDIDFMEYVETMLTLDTAFRKFQESRMPSK